MSLSRVNEYVRGMRQSEKGEEVTGGVKEIRAEVTRDGGNEG